MEDSQQNSRVVEAAPALISIHPAQSTVAVAIGSDLRVFDLRGDCGISLVDDSSEPFHKDSIRAIRYSASGKVFVSAGDDKLIKIWSTKSWHCLLSVCSEKRVSAVAISNDELHVCFADKFGFVWIVDFHQLDGTEAVLNKKPAPLLAHYCSIITSLEFSPDGRFIVSADRDFKIRVTIFPEKPLHGAHEIQSFCLGHTEYVSCLAFVCSLEYSRGFLVSGGGDSTVRLWDFTSGSLLDTCDVGAQAGVLEADGVQEGRYAVTCVRSIPDSNLVAVAVHSLQGIMLLGCDLSSGTLNVAKVISMEVESFIPTSLGCSTSGELLWMISGVSRLQGSDNNCLARVRILSNPKKYNQITAEGELIVLPDNEVPGAEKLIEKLQGSVTIEQNLLLAAADAVKNAMSNLLIKKNYSSENREFRKRTRNDRKIKQ